jgi:CPA2 family monovalent cation:H+ antiporter-2/trk system potassium uptake protein TrkA
LYNHHFNGRRIRDLPFIGDTLIIRIYRDGEVIMPRGDTELRVGDRLIISGTPAHVRKVERLLS